MPDGDKSLTRLDRLGLLTALIPELADAKGVGQPKEHFWDVFEHSLKTVAAVDFVLRVGTWDYHAKEALDAVKKSDLSELGQAEGLLRTQLKMAEGWLEDPYKTRIGWMGRALYLVVPNLEALNFKEAMVYKDALPSGAVALALGYGVLYAAGVVAVAAAIFTRRDLR